MSAPAAVIDASHVAARAEAPRRVNSWPIALAMLGALALAVGIGILDGLPVGVAADDAMYVILAKSMATGHGFRFLNLPGAPLATHFPPGYPALLALLWRIAPEFPANLMLFKAVNAVFLAMSSVAVARFARRQLGSAAWGLTLGVATAVSVPLLILGSMILSELFFLALLLLLLYRLEMFVAGDRAGRGGVGRAAMLGVALGLVMLVRTHAFVLLPAVALVLAHRRRWRDAVVLCVVAIACVLPWQLWASRHGNVVPAPLLGEYDSYFAWWVRGYRLLGAAMIPQTLARTLDESGGIFAALFSPIRGAAAHAVTLVALGAVAAAGVHAHWRRLPVTLLFLAGYLSIVALWPFPPGRFVWGVWPLLLLLLVGGAQSIVGRCHQWATETTGRRVVALAGAACVAWITWGYAAYELRAVRGQWWSSIARANAGRIVPAVQWTLGHTSPTDLVAAEDDGAVYLYTGRSTVPVRTLLVQQYLTSTTPRIDAQQGLLPVLDAYPVRTVLVGTTITLAEAQWLAAQPAPRLSLREEFAGGAAFTVLPR